MKSKELERVEKAIKAAKAEATASFYTFFIDKKINNKNELYKFNYR